MTGTVDNGMDSPSQKITAEIIAVITGFFGALVGAWKFWRLIGPRFRQWQLSRAVRIAGLERLPALVEEMSAIKEQLRKQSDPVELLESLRRVETALQGVRQTTWSILDISGMAFWEADAEGRMVYVSTRLAEIVGLSQGAAIGNGWVSTLHPEDKAKVFAEWMAAVEQRRFFAMKYRFQHLDGSITNVWGKGLPLFSATGQFAGFVGVLKELQD